MKRFVIPLLLASTAAVAQTAPDPTPIPPPLPQLCAVQPSSSAVLTRYMQYIFMFHGTTHTEGWNLDGMGLTGRDRDVMSILGTSIEGRTE